MFELPEQWARRLAEGTSAARGSRGPSVSKRKYGVLMNSGSEKPWWVEFNDDILSASGGNSSGSEPLLSAEIMDLLTDVDSVFLASESTASGWPDPDPAGFSRDQDAHDRVFNPEKFKIVEDRAHAWVEVLMKRGWAKLSPNVDWTPPRPKAHRDDAALKPLADGAIQLVLSTSRQDSGKQSFEVAVAAGNPAIHLTTVPDCECDGCDRGSDALLRDLDLWVLAVVDGSIEVNITPEKRSIRTFFKAESSTIRARSSSIQNLIEPVSIRGLPWSPGWVSRSLVDPVGSRAGGPRQEIPLAERSAFLVNLIDLFRGAVGKTKTHGISQIYRRKTRPEDQ